MKIIQRRCSPNSLTTSNWFSLYHEFPEHFIWNGQHKVWTEGVCNNKVIGRIYIVYPYHGELFFERILLNHLRGPTSFEDLRAIDDEVCATFKEAVERRRILEHDYYMRHTLIEASRVRMAPHFDIYLYLY
ncbi:hypothetical protein LIER_12151 [Lithospermum erythrorhizon]|uniref:Uncharacterized protein n=1 Tax=Lithospermum erythrorhizon TaxID=34254 RepID=A0AAV3PSN3_LITER